MKENVTEKDKFEEEEEKDKIPKKEGKIEKNERKEYQIKIEKDNEIEED